MQPQGTRPKVSRSAFATAPPQQLRTEPRPAELPRIGAGAGVRRGPPPHLARAVDDSAIVRGQQEVSLLLTEMGLELYTANFFELGFDDVECLLSIEDQDLKDLGVPTHKSMKLRRWLQQQKFHDIVSVERDHPVAIFLEGIGMPQYVASFIGNGFDEMEIVVDMDDLDFYDLGIPRGHIIKLKKRLREYQLHEYSQPVACQYSQEPPPYWPSSHHSILKVNTPQRRPVAHQTSALVSHKKLNSRQKSSVQRSWERVQEVGTFKVAEALYRNTFKVMPEAMNLFPEHVRMKYREWSTDEFSHDERDINNSPALRKLFAKFINAVGSAVGGLKQDDKLVSLLMKLGRRHINYGVQAAHFEVLGQAFQLTLAEMLGPDFTDDPEVQWGWESAYNYMSSIMLAGLNEATEERDAALKHVERGVHSDSSTQQVSDGQSALDAQSSGVAKQDSDVTGGTATYRGEGD